MHPNTKKQQGFTLIEIMVVIIILAILAAIVVPKIMSRPEQARMVKVKEDIAAIGNALSLYKLDNGTYPTTEQGLQALVKATTVPPIPTNFIAGGYLKSVPLDPWGQKYQYTQPGQHGEYDIFTTDPNKTTPGSSAPLVIGNWNMDKVN